MWLSQFEHIKSVRLDLVSANKLAVYVTKLVLVTDVHPSMVMSISAFEPNSAMYSAIFFFGFCAAEAFHGR